MGPLFRFYSLIGLSVLAVCPTFSEAAKKKTKIPIPIVVPEEKKDPALTIGITPSTAQPGAAFEELNFSRTLIIEGKVEKPAVQFTLLKEPPPEKGILFEASFLQNILKLDRENTFKVGETYGRE